MFQVQMIGRANQDEIERAVIEQLSCAPKGRSWQNARFGENG
jgi:hypothetical protein